MSGGGFDPGFDTGFDHGNTASLGGGITPTGAFSFKVHYHMSFSGGLTPTGVPAPQTAYKRGFAGEITPTGAYSVQRAYSLLFSGSITPIGTFGGRNPDWMVLDAIYNWQGMWVATTQYESGDAVLYQSGNYIHAFVSVANHNTGNLPTNPTYWKRLFQAKWRDK